MAERLSDKALAIFAFAAYHHLISGETVHEVVLRDGAGHAAPPEGVQELEAARHIARDGDRAAFTESGQAVFDRVLAGLRSSVA